MKLPNGYGSVYRLHGNRRKPWCVRLTVSTRPYKYKYLGYYETQAEGLAALAMYHKDPYDLDSRSATFADLYDRWSEEHYQKIAPNTKRIYRAAYSACQGIHAMRWSDIRLSHLQHMVDTCGKNYPVLVHVKLLLSQLYQYAMRHELSQKDYSRFVDISQYKDKRPNRTRRAVFTKEEIAALWASDDPDAKTVLVLIYTGVRIGELLELKKENVNLEEQWFDVVQSKTVAGIRRVPIADKILPFFVEMMQNDGDHVMGRHHSYHAYLRGHWHIDGHRPHDTRHTCISLLADAGTDERVIKKIVGHTGTGVTETVYTHFDFQILLDAINTI